MTVSKLFRSFLLIVALLSAGGCVYAPAFPLQAEGVTMRDTETGLVWAKNVNAGEQRVAIYKPVVKPQLRGINPSTYSLTYEEGQEMLEVMNEKRYGGHSDWRFPTTKEFRRLYDMAQDFDGRLQYEFGTLGFEGACGYFWTSTRSKYWTSDDQRMVHIGTCPWNVLQGQSSMADVWPVSGPVVDLPYEKRATSKAQGNVGQVIKRTSKAEKPKTQPDL